MWYIAKRSVKPLLWMAWVILVMAITVAVLESAIGRRIDDAVSNSIRPSATESASASGQSGSGGGAGGL